MTSKIDSRMVLQPRQPFGATVDGIDIAHAGNTEIHQLKLWLGEHGVVVLRNVFAQFDAADQTARDAAFVQFLAQLGPLIFTTGEVPVPHQSMLNIVSNMGRSTPPKSVFHTDTSYVSRPPAYTALRPVALPQAGGETVFSDQFLAFERLPPAVKERLAGAQVLHQVSGLPADVQGETQSWHPLFKVHPVSGRTALFLSTPQRCVAISGMPAVEAQRCIALLYRHSTRHYRALHHRWHANDMLVWDNRCTMHRGDHARVVGDRVFHRGMVLPEASADVGLDRAAFLAPLH